MKWTSLFLFILLVACNQNENSTSDTKTSEEKSKEKQKPAVSEFKDSRINASLQQPAEFTYLPSGSSTFTTERGTQITIPKNTFVHKNGEPVKEKVTLKYKEYHTPGEIILSGIPMTYDSAEVKKQFQSAGMFDIRAYVGGEEVVLAEGQSIDVELASNMAGNFNFYQFYDENKDWKMIAANQKPIDNTRKRKRNKELENELKALKKPSAPRPYKPGDKVFDIYINPDMFPDFSALNGIMWQYVGSTKENDPNLNPDFSKRVWDVVFIGKLTDNVYMLKFEKGKDTISIKATPVYQGAVLDKENKKFNALLDNFNAEYNRVMNEKKRNDSEYELLRKFNLTEMGLYNYDRFYKNPEVVPLVASFDFGMNINLEKNPVSVFLIPKGENAVIKYVPNTYDKFSFDPFKENYLIAVLPDNSICTFTSEDFHKVPSKRKEIPDHYKFKMRLSNDKILGPDDIDKLLVSN